jgi:single-strand DNA-binding protein
MARGLNKVMLIGNLGGDPEIKYSPNGTAIANIKLATNERRKNREGEWEDATEWHRIVMLGKQAETCKDYLKKGSKIYLEGKIQTRSWEDQNGKRQYMTEILGQSFIMLDPRGQDGAGGGQGSRDEHGAPDTGRNTDDSQPDDDLPF